MQCKDQEFTVGKGQVMLDGKSYYPDSVRLVVPKDQAIELAQRILRAHEVARPGDTHLLEIPLFGQLEEVEDE
ncbi:hypothetical protein H8F21_14095 [Pseudomonas sp. P66]|uniref:Uncharacterized protein n=1 Tax=Pseudomonas arcuscaelestis TaxID=2710591 RepID=A0ABS2BYI8_9PSED|nr:hypothetical protein [Pseudomonas arcuscaelestis]MBM5458696.1 hypothetical protein [Pseudomonas arcuscaelestis]